MHLVKAVALCIICNHSKDNQSKITEGGEKKSYSSRIQNYIMAIETIGVFASVRFAAAVIKQGEFRFKMIFWVNVNTIVPLECRRNRPRSSITGVSDRHQSM